jgi:hypothetical protein
VFDGSRLGREFDSGGAPRVGASAVSIGWRLAVRTPAARAGSTARNRPTPAAAAGMPSSAVATSDDLGAPGARQPIANKAITRIVAAGRHRQYTSSILGVRIVESYAP